MTDWNDERVRALVSAAEDAVQRTRWIFLVLNLGCAIMITAQLNLYGPWVRNVRERVAQIAQADDEKAEKEKIKVSRTEDVDQALRTMDKVLWDDLYNVQIPLLGIKYSADDLSVLGTASMSVMALWFVYAHRRENHCIGDLEEIAKKAKTKEPSLTAYIYSAVAHHFVFTTTTQNDEAYRSATTQSDETDASKGTKIALRWHVIVLIHLPWIASLIVILVMAATMFVPGLRLMKVLDPEVPPFFQFTRFEKFEAIARMAWGIGFTLLTRYYCIQAQTYDRDTNEKLVEMRKAAAANQPQ